MWPLFCHRYDCYCLYFLPYYVISFIFLGLLHSVLNLFHKLRACKCFHEIGWHCLWIAVVQHRAGIKLKATASSSGLPGSKHARRAPHELPDWKKPKHVLQSQAALLAFEESRRRSVVRKARHSTDAISQSFLQNERHRITPDGRSIFDWERTHMVSSLWA